MKSQFNHPVLSSNVVSLMVDMFTMNIPFPPSGFFGQKTSVTDALSLVVLPLDRPEKITKFKVFHCVLFRFWIKKLDYIRNLNKNYYWNVNGVGHEKKFKNRTMDFLDISPFINEHP